ncbi:MIF4G domain-containing protein-like [Haemaphysalis longicornis]|uniref:MIF4G domain-containing protein n=1 Tax=Haemaphysalis longicornis TaxID=44386 RepID=A0A9J6GSE5_HAELO|nr:hypothetical protein HPB48_008982 [Haemaphysalis longicornis]
MATAVVPEEQSCSGQRERPDGDSCPDGKEQDVPKPNTQRRPIVERATEDPGLLTPMETQCLVRVLCAKVAQGTGIGKFIADFCVRVISKQRGRAFADLLLTSIHQWFARRAELLPRAGDRPEEKAGEEPRYKWTAFVDFLAELLAAMTAAARSAADHKPLWLVSSVAVLLCDCCYIMLRCPALGVLDEMKCLQSSLAVAGKAAESVAAQQFGDLIVLIGLASKNPELPPEAQKILLELVELRATGWKN